MSQGENTQRKKILNEEPTQDDLPIAGRMLWSLSYWETGGELNHLLGSYVIRALYIASLKKRPIKQ